MTGVPALDLTMQAPLLQRGRQFQLERKVRGRLVGLNLVSVRAVRVS